MKNFLKRNAPILVIGTITMAIFIGIIVASESKQQTGPVLKYVEEDELIASYSPTKGNPAAVATLVEFSDFECPACGAAFPVLQTLLEQHGNDLRIVYRHFPLPQHKNAKKAAIAAQAAGGQDAFWEYHDLLFQNQQALEAENLVEYAKQLGLNIEQFQKDIAENKFKNEVEEDMKAGTKLGVNATPTFFLNGRRLEIKQFEDLYSEVNLEIQAVKKSSSTPANNLASLEEEEETTLVLPALTPENQTTGYVEITYTSSGFEPDYAVISRGQKIRWTNVTGKEMILRQTGPFYDELKDGVKIDPGQSFDFALYKPVLFSYEEGTTLEFGQISVRSNPDPTSN